MIPTFPRDARPLTPPSSARSNRCFQKVRPQFSPTGTPAQRPILRNILCGLGLLAASAVAACSHEPSAPSPAAQHTMAHAANALHGHWQVIDVYSSGTEALSPADSQALIGRPVTVSARSIQIASGQRCDAPTYVYKTMTQSEALGYRMAMGAHSDNAPAVTVTYVSCQGAPFARFLQFPSGAVLTAVHGSWASLVPASTQPAQQHEIIPMAMAAPPSMDHHDSAPHANATPPSTASSSWVHLASYRSESMAREGWSLFEKRYAGALQGFDPAFKTVTLPGKGTYVRLMATGGTPEQSQELCHLIRQNGGYCVVSGANMAAKQMSHSAH